MDNDADEQPLMGVESERDDNHVPNTDYVVLGKNIAKMCVVWTTASFSLYLMESYDDFKDGTVFTDSYYDASSALIACLITFIFYTRFSMQRFLQGGIFLTVLSGLLILLFE